MVFFQFVVYMLKCTFCLNLAPQRPDCPSREEVKIAWLGRKILEDLKKKIQHPPCAQVNIYGSLEVCLYTIEKQLAKWFWRICFKISLKMNKKPIKTLKFIGACSFEQTR